MKKCYKCQEEKSFEEFSKSKREKNGLNAKCKSCQKEAFEKWYQSRSPQQIQQHRQATATYRRSPHGRKKLKERSKLQYALNRKTIQEVLYQRRYGISLVDKRRLWELQSKQCAICKIAVSLEEAHTDHDHVSKKIRGILCANCNHGLGSFKDNLEYLQSAQIYLKLAYGL